MENQMTAEGLAALEAELAQLEGPAREEIAETIRVARGYGDLKENAEYHAAKEAQAHLETKILQLRNRIAAAEVVEAVSDGSVGLGAVVTVEDETSGRKAEYTIVSAGEASLSDGKLSAESPVATALSGKRAGDVAEVPAPSGTRRLKIVSVA
jgi:transcription elongation factor GreA